AEWRESKSWRAGFVSFRLGIETRGFFQENFFNPFPAGAPDRYRKARHFETRAGRRQITEPVEDQAADGVESVGFQFEPEMLAQVVQARVAAHEKPAVLERFDVKFGVAQGQGVANNFLGNIVERDDSFGAAEFIHDDGETLGVREKTAEQIH